MADHRCARVGLPARLPSRFRCHEAWRRLRSAGNMLGACCRPHSPCTLRPRPALPASLGTRSGVGRGRQQDRVMRQASAGFDGKHPDARDPMTRPISCAVVSQQSGASRPLDRGRSSAAGSHLERMVRLGLASGPSLSVGQRRGSAVCGPSGTAGQRLAVIPALRKPTS